MDIFVSQKTAMVLGFKKLEAFGIDKDEWERYNAKDKLTHREKIDLGALEPKKRLLLRALLEAHADAFGVAPLLRDLDRFEVVLTKPGDATPRTVRQFGTMLAHYLLHVPGHRLYEPQPDGNKLAYYVYDVEFTPEKRVRGDYVPADVTISMSFKERGVGRKASLTFYEEDVRGLNVAEALARKGWLPETEELRDAYDKEYSRWIDVTAAVGRQYLASGQGRLNLDDEALGDDGDRRWGAISVIDFVRGGARTRVVADVFRERDGQDDDRHRCNNSPAFWSRVREGRATSLDVDVEEDVDGWEEDLSEEGVELPVHPFVAVFDLAKHRRASTHVANLEEYKYDPGIIDKLVLPPDTKALVRVLVEHEEAAFKDVVEGKSGGAVVLLSGPPGTGKTLTAEVYAESEGRALYSVQCSQLGIDPEEVEKQLLIAFKRARRLKAVMLLDEADVYVRARGSDLTQNAIVGVFLRVMEYQANVLFLTTNRPDDVDDAVMSRCVARIAYRPPSPEDQAKLWRVLADGSAINLPDATVKALVKDNPGISGRDVKQLLKLAQVIVGKDPVTVPVVSFVRRFRPALNAKVQEGWTGEEQVVMERLRERAAEVKPGTSRFRVVKKTAG